MVAHALKPTLRKQRQAENSVLGHPDMYIYSKVQDS